MRVYVSVAEESTNDILVSIYGQRLYLTVSEATMTTNDEKSQWNGSDVHYF